MLRIYRILKTNKKEEDYGGGLESRLWFCARTDCMRLDVRNWGADSRVCEEEEENLEHFLLHCGKIEGVRRQELELQRPRWESSDEVVGRFLFGDGNECARKLVLLRMWNKRSRLLGVYLVWGWLLGVLVCVRVGWCSCGVGGCALVLGDAKLGMPLCVGHLAVVDGGWGGRMTRFG